MIEEIIEKELVDIHFQAIVSIRTKSIYAFESLTRCKYKNQNIPPNLLFNLASDNNLNKELDEMTRKKAIEKFHSYYLENKNLLLFLNVESELINNFETTAYKYSFIETITNLKIPFKNFILEIKEDEIYNMDALKKFCKTYKNLGFQIALDDFGTGSSNFHRINIIKPNIIKIDKSLFLDVRKNQVNKEIVSAISKMSHNLGIRVLAEGVEDSDSIYTGMKSSINLFQGFYFHKPSLELSESDNKEIVKKCIEVGKSFKTNNMARINRKRESIEKFNLIANILIDRIENISKSVCALEDEFKKYSDIEAIYLIDGSSSKQINDTIMDLSSDSMFKPTMHGEEHFLKEYYYITIESKRGIYLSQKYVSYATGNVCKTFAKKFKVSDKEYILCLDIVIEELNNG